MLNLPDRIVEELLAHAVHALPKEACGILVGHDDTAERALPILNVAEDNYSFFFDASEQLALWQEMEQTGEELVAIYHSHPTTEAVPTRADELGARRHWSVSHVIVSIAHPDHQVRSYRAEHGGLMPEPINLVTKECT